MLLRFGISFAFHCFTGGGSLSLRFVSFFMFINLYMVHVGRAVKHAYRVVLPSVMEGFPSVRKLSVAGIYLFFLYTIE